MARTHLHLESGLWVAGPDAADEPGAAGPRHRLWLRRLRRFVRDRLVGRPEDELLDSAVGDAPGPNRLALPLVSLVVLPPLAVLLVDPENPVALTCVGFGAVALAYSSMASQVERRPEIAFWMAMLSGLVYAVIITGVMLAFLAIDHPRAYTRAPLVFTLYLFLIGAIGLSDDPRPCVSAGVFSILGSLLLLPLIDPIVAISPPAKAAFLERNFDWVANLGKVVLLSCATLLAVASASRGRELRRASLCDGLTGLINRRAFDHCLELEARRAARTGHPLSVAMLDVDYFKRINDEHGHAMGDAVLRWVSSKLRESVRTTDLVARYGGEEFVVAFLDTEGEPLAERLEALRSRIAGSALHDADFSDTLRVTVSIGVASLPADGATLPEVLGKADQRMYQAKQAGRNRIVAGPPGAPAPAR